MNRAERLKKAVKHSKVTADAMIVNFENISQQKNIELPTSPVTISRHLNGKRAFGIEEAEAYAESMGVDPAGILFSAVKKNIAGYYNLEDRGDIEWEEDVTKVKSIRVPREFFHERYKVLESRGVDGSYHGSLAIYEKMNNQKEFLDVRLFGQLSIIDFTIKGKKKTQYCMGIPKPISRKNFMILGYSGQIVYENVTITKISPVASTILPAFWRHYMDE